jgi:hypothetical protein
MSIPLRIVDPRPVEPEPGMMWRYPPGDVEGRDCWWIVLPGADPGRLELSWRTTDRAARPPHEMWDVSGEPPHITVRPSIDVERWTPEGIRAGSYWHGFIRNGELEPA